MEGLFAGFVLPMQNEFPRFGAGLRSEICRLAPWIVWDSLAITAYFTDGNQVAPLTREHPRRRYTPVDYHGTLGLVVGFAKFAVCVP